jgi:hypothetical protein
VSDRAAWLEEWCPYCRAAPRARCRLPLLRKHRPPTRLHVARGWRARRCPTCKALPGEPCHAPSGREAARPHAARASPGRAELLTREATWTELERRGATIAAVPFTGRAGEGGRVGTIVLSRFDDNDLVDVERWTGRDELAFALEAPVWDRFGSFAGHPRIAGTVAWTTVDRTVLISGRRGGDGFEEIVA